MDEAGTKAKEGARTASSRLGRALARPVTARLAEPAAWAIGLALTLARLSPESSLTILRVGALFLAARLAADTAPNLRAAARLEAEPYDQRPLRRALFRVKLTLALSCALVTWGLLLLMPALTEPAGGAVNVWVALLALLSTYAVATPVLREHRGLPVARPNVGPAAGALLFALTVAVAPPATAGGVLVRASACIVLGNLVLGLGQRYKAAARRIDRPFDSWAQADPRNRDVVLPRAERDLVRHALTSLPILLLPVWPAICAAWSGRVGDPRWLLAAAAVTALPAIVFDVTRPGPRTTWTALVAAALLAGAAHHAPPPDDAPLLAAAATALLIPGASVLIARSHTRTLALAATAILLARAFSTDLPHTVTILRAWPVPESLGAIAVTIAALVARRTRPA